MYAILTYQILPFQGHAGKLSQQFAFLHPHPHTQHTLLQLQKKGYTFSKYRYESTLVKMPRCWKSHVTAHCNMFHSYHAR